MILTLALALSLHPQDPGATGLAAHLGSLDLKEHADRLVARIARSSRPRRMSRGPSLLRQVRSGAQPLVDPALDLVALPGPGAMELGDVEALVQRLLGVRRRRVGTVGAMDLDRFQSLLKEVYQDLHRALGREPEPDERRPQLHAALEELRATTGVDEMDEATRERLQRGLRHAQTVDLAELERLSCLVIDAALGLERPELLARLRRRPGKPARRDVVGDVLLDRETSFGRFVVGGFGNNVYDCTQIDVIVDLGGDDVYRGPAGATMNDRPLGVVVDLAGNDTYEALNDGLGSATYGLGMLLDLAGDDHYSARSRSAGFGAAGLGLFADLAGDDVVELGFHSGGVGLEGAGLFIDLAGADQHHADGQSFGLGLPGGLGLFVDGQGNDQRKLGALRIEDSRGTAELSLGFGAGVGLSNALPGGVGLFLDAEGDDQYQASGSVALGAGTHGGLGMFFDLLGDDRYRSGTGSQGMAHHFGKALFFEGAGQDDYAVFRGYGMGAASHAGEAWFVDLQGDDLYRLGGMGLGEARASAMAGFLDLSGADRYLKEQTQSPWPARGPRSRVEGALSLFLDEGEGDNRYAWATSPSPRKGEQRRVETADGKQAAVIVVVDR